MAEPFWLDPFCVGSSANFHGWYSYYCCLNLICFVGQHPYLLIPLFLVAWIPNPLMVPIAISSFFVKNFWLLLVTSIQKLLKNPCFDPLLTVRNPSIFGGSNSPKSLQWLHGSWDGAGGGSHARTKGAGTVPRYHVKRAFGGGCPQKKGGKNCVKTGLLLSIPWKLKVSGWLGVFWNQL